MAQLSEKASGKYFFFTDADTAVPENWVLQMLPHFENETGIVSGITLIKPKSILGAFQCIDWVLAQGLLKIMGDIKMPVSAVGNNMAVSKKAYDSVGGYKKIPFSVTEDFELFRQLRKKSWKSKNLFYTGIMAEAMPIKGFGALLHQRKRWMQGGPET